MHRDWSTDFTDFQWKTLDRGTQADTFIEWCFEQKCFDLSQGSILKNEWRNRKQAYISRLQTTIFDFQHFSRHDDSHSINILNSIELVLGRNRIKLLSASDLWLLLESAYFHDIGMALSDSQIREIWTSEEFHTYLQKTLAANDIDEKKAANYYLQIDNLLNGKGQLSGLESERRLEFSKEWPVDFRKNMSILTAAYVRKIHPQRSKTFMEAQSQLAQAQKDAGMPVIKSRMNRLVALISELHGLDFVDIRKKVVYQDLGFDTEYLHPQFAAAMLRLGDLLDMDNNRFNIRAMEHFGSLPILSQYYYGKHKAICHFSITSERIEALAISNDDHVCREVSKWFQWLKEEVENLNCDWNDFAPQGLKGCTLRRCKLNVKFGDSGYNTEFQKNFQVDQARLISLMVGSNIYNSKLDCFREYLQNALDASKMRLWLDIVNGKMGHERNKKPRNFTPFDILRQKYEEKAIEIKISVFQEGATPYVCLEITDQGVGMESNCVNGLSVVGHGWKQRTLYQDEILKMPEWLKPTGGFGIGLQSAFMLTDHITITTRSIKESTGFKIELDTPQKGGSIIKMQQEQYSPGTTVKLQIALDTLYGLIQDIKQLELNDHKEFEVCFDPLDGDAFLKHYNEEYIYAFLKYYLKKQIPNPIFPIKITSGKRSYTYRSPYASKVGGFGPLEKPFLINDRYICSVSDDLTVRIWDQAEQIFVCVLSWPIAFRDFDQEKGKLLNHFCYRNIKVQNIKERDLGLRYQNFLSVCMDIMSKQTEDVLSLRRNDFVPEFNLSQYYQKYLAVYVEAIYNQGCKRPLSDISRYLDIYLYVLLAIQVSDQKTLKRVLEAFQEKTGTAKRAIKTVNQEDYTIRAEHVPTEEVLQRISSIFARKQGRTEGRCLQTLFIVAREPLPPINDIPACSLQDADAIEDVVLKSIVTELNEGAWIYADPAICQALSHIGSRFHMTYFFIREDKDADKLVYAAIRGLEEDWNYEPSNVVSQEEFLKKAFWMDKGRRYIGENVDCKEFHDLRVTQLPARQQAKVYERRIRTYLISPISGRVFNKLLLAMDISDLEILKDSSCLEAEIRAGQALLPKDKFVELITKEEDYQFLISWVHQHRCPDADRLDLEEIDDMYKKMLEDMYGLIFNGGGSQSE